MSEFTPGPWQVFGPDDEPYGDIGVGKNGRRICRLWQDDAPVPEYNSAQWANARLIAAAPEMVDLLRLARDEFRWLAENGPGGRAGIAGLYGVQAEKFDALLRRIDGDVGGGGAA